MAFPTLCTDPSMSTQQFIHSFLLFLCKSEVVPFAQLRVVIITHNHPDIKSKFAQHIYKSN